MSSFNLHYRTKNYTVWKIEIVAKYCNINLNLVEHKNPKDFDHTLSGKGPYIEDVVSGTQICGSNSIITFFSSLRPESNLLGTTFQQQTKVNELTDLFLYNFEASRNIWLLPVLKQMDFSQRTYFQAKKDVTNVIKKLDQMLQHQTYLTGHTITVADVTWTTGLIDMYTTVFGTKFQETYPNVLRWFNTVTHQQQVQAVLGVEVKFTETEQKAPKPVKKNNKVNKKKLKKLLQKNQQQHQKKNQKIQDFYYHQVL